MKNLLLVVAVLLSTVCFGQTGNPDVYKTPVFKEEKCIVIYLDVLKVKADSCTKFYKADKNKVVHHYPAPNKDGTVYAVIYADTYEHDWYVFKVIRKNKKEIPLKDIIQYK